MHEHIKILVVDDEEKIRSLVKMYLQREGFKIDEAADGDEALTKIKKTDYNLVVLDLMLPVIDGMAVCREVRSFSDVPIIMLTAKGDEVDKLVGFEMGADDYVVKPFSPREVVARVKALLKRTKGNKMEQKTEKLEFPGLIMEMESRRVFVEGKEITLTPKEYDLFYYLASNKGRVFSREKILEEVWGYDYFGDLRTVDTHIKNLREKIAANSDRKYIHTVWGVGYKFEVVD
ncbi:MAG: two-component system, OmpR family, response regulator ResD [Clostridia bacterium]|jgi:two-component system response regulator ResD|nr:response regulator with CheY-like receiver domain and winged-helix DNA-binding domain [Clostridiales bacterium]MDK2985463.1 two-component system, OmpR family, response regulator ResD [Clostridia bacterium]